MKEINTQEVIKSLYNVDSILSEIKDKIGKELSIGDLINILESLIEI